MYVDAQRDFPRKDIHLETADGTFYLCKSDTFKRQLTYSSSPDVMANLQVISVERALEVIEMNRRGEKPVSLVEKSVSPEKTID